MPKEFHEIITIELPIPVRQKKSGVYEARLRRKGLTVCVSSADREKLKDKFLNALVEYAASKKAEEEAKVEPQEKLDTLFDDIAARWLELKRPTIKKRTFIYYESLFRVNILPVFSGREIGTIRQSEVQALINDYVEDKPRTAVKIYQTLKAMFDFAVGDDRIEKSPMRLLKSPKYEEQTGVALTLAEEKAFVELVCGSKCIDEVKHALLFLLYTGIRRSELASARIGDGFVTVVCSKVRKGYRAKTRQIPITPMLERWLPEMDFETVRTVRPDALTQAMKRLMPNHHLHELRHTFITRSQECGVPREVVSVWAGHAADNTQTSNVYTHFSPEFMLKEAKKVIYNL